MNEEISISKEVLPSLDPTIFKETWMGERRGAIKQYRTASGLHVREYENRFVLHIDKVDPRVNPIGHLLFDSPETLFAFGASTLFVSKLTKKSEYTGNDRQFSFSPLSFLFLFLSLKNIFKIAKELVFG